MINKEIIINKETRAIINGENGDLFRLGVDGENLQENIIFKFQDEFVDGTARVEITMQNNTKSYVMTTKVNETYVLPIKSVITKKGLNRMQLVITQGTNDEEIPIFKSRMFGFFIDESINADTEQPEGYPQWLDEANTKLNQMDNFDIDAVKEENVATMTITDRYGISKSVQVTDGIDGTNGKDAKINGVNTLRMVAGTNITLEQENDTLTINSQGGGSGGTSDYLDLTNKPTINNVELTGNKTTSDLGIVIPTVPTNVSAFTNDAGYLTQHQDISGKQDKIDSSHKLSSDLVDDTNNTNLFVSSTEKETWNAKSNFSGNYNDLTNKPVVFYLGNATDYTLQNPLDISVLDVGLYAFNVATTSDVINVIGTINDMSFTGTISASTNSNSYSSNYIAYLKITQKISTCSPTTSGVKVGVLYYSSTYSTQDTISYFTRTIKAHTNSLGTSVYISDSNLSTFTLKVVTTDGNQTISGEKTFSSIPKQSNTTAPTQDAQFTNKKYVDDSITNAITTTLGGSF